MDTKSPNYTPAQNYPYPIAPQQPGPYPVEPQYPQPAGGCSRNCPQFLSVGAGACIIFTGGMSMAYGLGFVGWSSVTETKYMNVCWFVMAIVGALCSAILTNILQKKILVFLSSALVMIGGILFISLYDNFGAVMAARHINGFAVGWILITTFVMAGEEAAKEVRGTLISTVEAVFFSFGIFIQILYTTLWTTDINKNFESNQMHGTLVLCFGAIAFLLTIKQVIESPVYFLKKDQEQLALDSLLRLQRPCVMNAEKSAQLQEHKQYIAESSGSGTAALSALLKVCFLRSIIGLSFTAIVTKTLLTAIIGSRIIFVTAWPLIVYGACRFCGALIGSFLQDSLGRKLTLIFSMLICGGMAIGIGVAFHDAWDYFYYPWKMTMAMVFIFVYQFFIGISITSSSSYLTEAFPVTAKPYCIAFVLAFEMIMFVIGGTVDIYFKSISQYFYALGSISFVMVVFTILCFPETKKTTLREALQKFENFVHISFR